MMSAALDMLCWDGIIPVAVELATNEVTTLEGAPSVFYTMMPRLSYLTVATADIVDHFRDSAPMMSGANDVWFDHEGMPLNWQLPAGILYDLHHSVAHATLPWKLTVHFTSYPDQLVKGEGEDPAKRNFFQALKQGLFLEHGSNSVAMSIPRDNQTQLWRSLCDQEAVAFCHINRDLKAANPKHVPVRFVLHGAPVVQVPCLAVDAKGLPRTLGGILNELWPESSPYRQAVCHGVAVDLDAPLVEVWRALAHPDHFLYILVNVLP